MDIEWFYSFLETAEQKSLSKASEKLNITQPALSKQIRHLEEHLGVELFRRSARGVELTDEGVLLRERICSILSELDLLKKDLLNLNKLSSIRLGSLPSLAAYYLPGKLVRMGQCEIHVDLKVKSTTSEVIELITTGSIDVGIVHKPKSITPGYWYKDLFNEPYYAVIPDFHPLQHRTSVTLEDLKNMPLVVYPSTCDIRNSIIEGYKKRGLKPLLDVELNFGESIPGFVAAGAGITILPGIIAKNLTQFPLRAIPITEFSETRTICMICRKPSLGKKIAQYF